MHVLTSTEELLGVTCINKVLSLSIIKVSKIYICMDNCAQKGNLGLPVSNIQSIMNVILYLGL